MLITIDILGKLALFISNIEIPQYKIYEYLYPYIINIHSIGISNKEIICKLRECGIPTDSYHNMISVAKNDTKIHRSIADKMKAIAISSNDTDEDVMMNSDFDYNFLKYKITISDSNGNIQRIHTNINDGEKIQIKKISIVEKIKAYFSR